MLKNLLNKTESKPLEKNILKEPGLLDRTQVVYEK